MLRNVHIHKVHSFCKPFIPNVTIFIANQTSLYHITNTTLSIFFDGFKMCELERVNPFPAATPNLGRINWLHHSLAVKGLNVTPVFAFCHVLEARISLDVD